MSSMKIATKEDIPAIVEIAGRMHGEGQYKNIPFDPKMYAAFLDIVLFQNTTAVCFLSVADDIVVGGIIGQVGNFPFSEELRAVDLGFYVVPEYRGTSTALRLLKMYENWAEGMGVAPERVYMASSNGHHKTHVFFEKMGYNLTGGLYQKFQEQEQK